jgi:hypothetical protein
MNTRTHGNTPSTFWLTLTSQPLFTHLQASREGSSLVLVQITPIAQNSGDGGIGRQTYSPFSDSDPEIFSHILRYLTCKRKSKGRQYHQKRTRRTGWGIRKLTCCSSRTSDLANVLVCLSVSSINMAPLRALGGLELPLLRPATA